MTETSPLAAAQAQFVAALPLRALAGDSVALHEAVGRTLYHDVTAPADLPPYHRTIVEGYLVHTDDTAGASESAPVIMRGVGKVVPGDEHCSAFAPGEAGEVATGSVVPGGPYSIVRMWEAKRDGERFTISRPFAPRFFIEEQGSDLKQGSVVAAAGTLLCAAELGQLAALGITAKKVCAFGVLVVDGLFMRFGRRRGGGGAGGGRGGGGGGRGAGARGGGRGF